MDFQERLDRLINGATKRRNDALQLLEYYRTGLGRRLRELTDNIIDGNAVELNNPNMIAKHVGSDGVEAKEISERNTLNPPTVDNRSVTPAKGGDNT